MNLVLKVIEGPHQGKTFAFEDHDVFVVGRAADVHFPLPNDPYFSRNHFLIELNPPLCRITDLNSRNGTEVNGRRIAEPTDLRHGDRIRGGETSFEVALGTMELDPFRTINMPSAPFIRTMLSPEDDVVLPENPGPDPGVRPRTAGEEPVPAIPGYRVLQRLGEGGMGVVYKAQRESDGSMVAVKTIQPRVASDTHVTARFLREAEILKRLRHPNIVSFSDMGQSDRMLYFAMEYVPGPNLVVLRRQHAGPFPIARAVRLILQILDGLAHAHRQGYVHRDVKPANVLVSGTAQHEQAKLADFGLARAYQASSLSGLTLSGATGGTPHYIPPEQILDFRTARPPADQYSTAATLYFLLTGQSVRPGARDVSTLLSQILNEDARPIQSVRPDVPPALAAAIDRALRRKVEERFADTEAFRQALLPFATP